MRRLTLAALSPAFRWFVATLSVAATAAGQDSDPPLPEVFGEFLDVRVVNIEVVVTDGAGRRVSGLGVGDFVLTVDGGEVPIEYFSEVAAGAARESAGVEPLPGVAPGEHVGTSFLVYVDDNHTRKVDRDPIVLGLIDQLSALGELDRMAVVVQHGTRLQLLSGWSSSRSELRSALEQLLDGGRYGGSARSQLVVARTLGLRPGDHGLADVADDGPAGASPSPAPFEADDDSLVERSFLEVLGGAPMRLDLELAVAGAISAMRGFAKPEGRKVMLLLAGDWPLGTFRSGVAGLDVVTDLDLTRPLIETANLLGYTIYPIGEQASYDLWRNASAKEIAARTGGLTLYDRSELLRGAVADTRSYYWLGFVPAMSGDDARHRVRVELRRPNLHARTRDSYVDLSRAAELSMMAQSALLFGQELPEGPVLVQFGAAARKGLRKMMVPVDVFVPLDELTFVAQAGADRARIEIRLAVIDESGSQADIPILGIDLAGTYRPGEIYRYSTMLRMRRRPHDMLVSVHDVFGARTLNGRATVSYRSTQQP